MTTPTDYYIQNGGGGTSRCGVLDLWTGLQIKIKNSIQRQHTAVLLPVVIQRNGQPLPAPAPAVAYASKFDNSLITLHYTLANPAAYGITDYDKAHDLAHAMRESEEYKELMAAQKQ